MYLTESCQYLYNRVQTIAAVNLPLFCLKKTGIECIYNVKNILKGEQKYEKIYACYCKASL